MNDSQDKILIVDDDDLIRTYMLRLFELYEIEAECVANGQEAVEIMDKKDFTAVLMDLEMPIMGGFESSRIIRLREKEKKRTHTPIYAVSGTTTYNIQSKCSTAGMDGFIAKPIVVNKLLEVILPLVR